MIWQYIVVFLLLGLAVAYTGRMFYKQFTKKTGCGADCKCGTDFSKIDLSKIEK